MELTNITTGPAWRIHLPNILESYYEDAAAVTRSVGAVNKHKCKRSLSLRSLTQSYYVFFALIYSAGSSFPLSSLLLLLLLLQP